MMSELFDEKYLRKQYDLFERKKSFAEGKCDALKSVAEKLRKVRLSYEQIKKLHLFKIKRLLPASIIRIFYALKFKLIIKICKNSIKKLKFVAQYDIILIKW